MQKRSLLVQVLLDMATGGGAKLEALLVDRAGTFDAGLNKGYNPVTVPSGNASVYGEKGTVENHSVVVVPKVQLSRGWLNEGEVEGAGVGVTADELVDGTYNVSRAGTADVTNYKDVNVNAGGTTSYLERTTIDEHSVRLTPKAEVTGGWQDNKTVTGESVDVDASGLVSGTYPVTASGEFDVTTYEKISVPSGVVSARAIKGMVANHSVLITPSATRTAGFISSGETAGQDIRVDASELVSGTLNVSQAGTSDVTNYAEVSVPSGGHTARGVKGTVSNHSVSVTPRSTATAGFVASGSVDGTPVSVSASELVSGTLNVSQAGTSDVTNYAEVSVPSGSHSASATKGAVSNHNVTITPKSTATAGFVTSGSVNGTPVSVSASELVSGKLNVSQAGTSDVTNYAEVSVPSGSHSASATKGAVSNHNVTITPKSTATAGFVTSGSVNGTPVSVSASELVSGRLAVTSNGVIDVTNYKEIEVSGVVQKELIAEGSGGISNSTTTVATINVNDPNKYSGFIVEVDFTPLAPATCWAYVGFLKPYNNQELYLRQSNIPTACLLQNAYSTDTITARAVSWITGRKGSTASISANGLNADNYIDIGSANSLYGYCSSGSMRVHYRIYGVVL